MGRYAVLAACTILPFVFANPSNILDIDKLIKREQPVEFSETCKEAIKALLPLFEQKGWLDFETH
jgi:hypothetical protein